LDANIESAIFNHKTTQEFATLCEATISRKRLNFSKVEESGTPISRVATNDISYPAVTISKGIQPNARI